MAYYQDTKGNIVKLTDKALKQRDSKDYIFVGLTLRNLEKPKKSFKRGKK